MREPCDRGVVEIDGQTGVLVALLARDLFLLTLDISRVLSGDFELRANLRREPFVMLERPCRR